MSRSLSFNAKVLWWIHPAHKLTFAIVNIVHAASEVFPFMKTGGLADVSAALTKALASYGHTVSVFLPGYRAALQHPAAEGAEKILSLQIDMDGKSLHGHVLRVQAGQGRSVFFICRDEFFDRRFPYGTSERDYDDNADRFIFFCKAVVESMRLLNLGADVIHCHDWQTGLLPLFVRAEEGKHEVTLALRTLFTIHNIAFQGVFPISVFKLTGLPDDLLGIDGLEYYGQLSMIKGGILFADRLTTVSPSYAVEILDTERGAGLDGVLASRGGDMSGLLNGIDQELWDPATDEALPFRFSGNDMAGKQQCRADLLNALRLDPSESAPVFSMVCRLTEQKGIHLFLRNAGFFARNDVRVVVVGTGEERFEEALHSLGRELGGKFAFLNGMDESIVRRVIAGSDYFLMPSVFEPCGLTQMYAQRYGTIPLTSAVGGLLDTVVDLVRDPSNATGIQFPPTESGLASGLEAALQLHANPAQRLAMVSRGMRRDFGWETAGRAYERLYQEAL